MRKIARILFAVIVFIPICLFVPVGLRFLWVGVRIRLGAHFYYPSHPNLFLALYLLIPSALATWIIFLVALGRKSWAWLTLPALIALVVVPSGFSNFYLGSEQVAKGHLMNVARASSEWVKKTGHLPQTPKDIELSIEQYLGSKQRMSPYGLGRDRIPYKFVVVKRASGPLLEMSQAQQPGLIFYALSADSSPAWITGTGTVNEFSGRIHFLRRLRAGRAEPAVEVARVNGYQEFSE